MTNVTITAVSQKRNVVILLAITGTPTIKEARETIIQQFNDSEINGDIAEGPWQVKVTDNAILFENELFGSSISNDDIKTAIAAKGREIVC